jgi:MFS family permease
MYNRAISNRLFYTLFLSQSLYSAAQIAVVTLLAIVSVRLGGTESVAGLSSSVTTFSQALAAFPVALVMGRFGRRLGLSLGYAVCALGGLVGIIAILQGIFPLLLVSAALMGLSRGAGDQSRFAAGEMFPEAERARMIGRLVFAGTVGAVAGPLLVSPSGYIMESLGLHRDIGPWVGMCILCGIAALVTFLLLRPDPMTIARTLSNETENSVKNVGNQLVRPLATLLMLPHVQLGVLAVLISQTVMVVLMVMTPLYMEHLHHTRDSISLVISMHTLGMYGLSPLTGYLIDRFGRVRMLLIGALLFIIAAILAPAYTDQFILAAALFLLGLGWNFGYVSGSSLLADALQGEERARVQGVNDSLVFLAAGVGSLAAGPLFARGGYAAVSSAGLILTFILIALILRLSRPHLQPEAA